MYELTMFSVGFINDLALLFVDADFDLVPNVDTACLPRPGSKTEANWDGEKCWVTGWEKEEGNRACKCITYKNAKFENKVQF
jgi:hypothetical protein